MKREQLCIAFTRWLDKYGKNDEFCFVLLDNDMTFAASIGDED